MSAKSESYEEEIPSDNSKLDNNLEKEEDENQLIEEINENYKYMNQTNDELTVEELREKIRRSGVLYMSHVPVGMKIIDIRKLLDDYGIQRCYFIPYKKKLQNVDGKRVQAYKEGWIEFEDKIYAKLAEYQLNGKPIGGNKKCIYQVEDYKIGDFITKDYSYDKECEQFIEEINNYIKEYGNILVESNVNY